MASRSPLSLLLALSFLAAPALALDRAQLQDIARKVSEANDEAATAAHTQLVAREVLKQGWGSFELRVGDEGSYEGTRAACELIRIGAVQGAGDYDFLGDAAVVERIRQDMAEIRRRILALYGDGSVETLKAKLIGIPTRWTVTGVIPHPQPIVRFPDAVYEEAKAIRAIGDAWLARNAHVFYRYFLVQRSRDRLRYAYGDTYIVREERAKQRTAERFAQLYPAVILGLDEAEAWLERDLQARAGAVTGTTGTSTWKNLPPSFGGLPQN